MKLFISHASEDKASFVDQLAAALKEHYEIWYDNFALKVGRSLLEQISKGLSECDYGIVVLSPDFFRKKWPQAELDGLFALETPDRKIILPVLKDISAEEVSKHSPILAGRFAAPASAGVEAVVAQIRQATGVAERMRELSPVDRIMKEARTLAHSLKHKQDAEFLMQSPQGVYLVEQSLAQVCEIVERQVAAIQKETPILNFQVQNFLGKKKELFLYIKSQKDKIGIACAIPGLTGYSAASAKFKIEVGTWANNEFEQEGRFQHLRQTEYDVFISAERTLLWKSRRNTKHNAEEMAEIIFKELIEETRKVNKLG